MLRSIWDDVKREFDYGNMVTRIIIINVAIFVVINLIEIALFLFNGWKPNFTLSKDLEHLFSLPAHSRTLLFQPWSVFTHMFLHVDFFHILWNMLSFYWFGRIVGDFIGNHRILPIYIMGGLAGAIVYFASANLLAPEAKGTYALGASAAVMATVGAAGTIAPNFIMRLLFIGDVKLKYIVAVLIFLDLITVSRSVGYAGGPLAHLGGAFFGIALAWQLQQGNDWTRPFNQLTNTLDKLLRGTFFRRRQPGPRVAYRRQEPAFKAKVGTNAARKTRNQGLDRTRSHQEQLDEILDKIKQSGYESLSAEEKEFLFNASKQ